MTGIDITKLARYEKRPEAGVEQARANEAGDFTNFLRVKQQEKEDKPEKVKPAAEGEQKEAAGTEPEEGEPADNKEIPEAGWMLNGLMAQLSLAAVQEEDKTPVPVDKIMAAECDVTAAETSAAAEKTQPAEMLPVQQTEEVPVQEAVEGGQEIKNVKPEAMPEVPEEKLPEKKESEGLNHVTVKESDVSDKRETPVSPRNEKTDTDVPVQIHAGPVKEKKDSGRNNQAGDSDFKDFSGEASGVMKTVTPLHTAKFEPKM